MTRKLINTLRQHVVPDYVASATDNPEFVSRLRKAQINSIRVLLAPMALASAAGAFMLAAILSNPERSTVLILWVMGFLSILAIYPVRQFLKSYGVLGSHTGRPIRLLCLQIQAAGVLWAAGVIMFYPGSAADEKTVVGLAMLGVISSGTIAFNTIPAISGIFAIITSFGLIVALMLDHNPQLLPATLLIVFFFSAIKHAVNESGRVFIENLVRQYELEKSKELFSVLFKDFEDSSSDWLWEISANGCITHISSQFHEDERTVGFPIYDPAMAFLFRDPADISKGNDRPRLHRQLFGAFRENRPFKDVVAGVMINEKWRYWKISGRPVHAADGEFLGMRGACSDISDSYEAERRLQYLAMHDAMTDLPNREGFSRAFSSALNHARLERKEIALLAIDLDKFKMVNDRLGHQAGDRVLRAISDRLRKLSSTNVVFARFGGDEFCAFVSGNDVKKLADSLAGEVIETVTAPIGIGGGLAEVGCSIGIAVYPTDGENGEALHRNADLALYRAKSMPQSCCCVFEPAMDAHARKRQDIEYELQSALKREEFELYFQPLACSRTGKITGYETLLRWNSRKFGRVSPDEFIRIAEKSGMIKAIGEWVIRRACLEAASWKSDASVAINLSPRQLEGFRLINIVASALSDSGLSPSRLELEVTETALETEPEHAAGLLKSLRSLGARISLDDFGTGYSSLSYLVRFPIDKLKIDKCFVQGSMTSEHNIAIIRAIVSLARTMKMRTTAEGVETSDQADMLRREGIDEFQGYLISRPKPASFLAERERGSAKRLAG